MSSILKDRLKWNFEKAINEGRNVLVRVCRVRLKGVPVADKLVGLSNSEKRSLGFNKDQIRLIEAGCDLNDMDISLLYLIIRVFGGLSPVQLQELKQLKDIRNTFVHENQTISLDKTKLRSKLSEFKVLYTSILEDLKNGSDPDVVTLLDQDIADLSTRLLSLEATLDDDILEHTTDLVMASNTAVVQLTQFSQATSTLDQASEMYKEQTIDIVAKTNELTQASAIAVKQIDTATFNLGQCLADAEARLASLEKSLNVHTQNQESAQSVVHTTQYTHIASVKRKQFTRRISSVDETVLHINDVMKASGATTEMYKGPDMSNIEESPKEEELPLAKQIGKDALLIKAVEEADTVSLIELVKSVDELDTEMVSVAHEIAIANTNVAAIKLLDLARKKISQRK
ncbi:unnamed protein product, partial [Meganyctiphanes norvegica]